jgi:hypothetical protein
MVCYNNYYRPTMERSYMNNNSSGYAGSSVASAATNGVSPCGGDIFGCIINLIIIMVVVQFLTSILCNTTCDVC